MPVGYELLVKVHMSDADGWPAAFFQDLAAIPSVRLIDPQADSRKLLNGAALTITNSGTMAYEAGLLGRPAITFSRVHFNVLPTVHYCGSIVELPQLIDKTLRRAPQPDDEQRIIAVLSEFFAHSFAGLPNRALFYSDLTDTDLEGMVGAYRALHAFRQRTLRRGTNSATLHAPE
jgi:hypothetical protein